MRIRTKIPVQYSVGISTTETATGVIEGVIDSVSWVNNPSTDVFDQIQINYRYMDESGNQLFQTGQPIIGSDELEGLFQVVKGSIPQNRRNAEQEQTKFYLQFIQSMALTFNISPTDIEIFQK